MSAPGDVPPAPGDVPPASGDVPVAAGTGAVAAGPGLGQRAARGAAVTLGGQLSRMVLQIGSVVVLSRLLTPSDYGLLATVLVVVGIGEIVRDFGLTTAAVQARELRDRQRDGLFWLNSAIGLLLCLLVAAGAPLLGAAFGRPELTDLARVLSLTFLVNGLATQYRANLSRSLRFGALVSCDVAGQALGLTTAIVVASLGGSYWSLAVQQLVQVTTVLVGVVVLGRWRPGRPRRDSGIRPLVTLGSRLAATQILYYITNNLDTITIASRFSPAQLGLYNRGFQLVMTPSNQLRSPATTVALPVLSRVQDDPERAAPYLVRGQLAFGYTLIAGLFLVAGTSGPLVAFVLGPTWTGVSPILAFLAIAAAMTTLSFVGSWVYMSRGLGRELLHYTAVTFVLQLVCILVGSIWGVEGVAGGYAAAALLEWPLSLVWLSRRTSIPLRALLWGAVRISLSGALAGTVAFVVTRVLPDAPDVLRTLAGFAGGLGVYGVLTLLCAPIRRDVLDVVDVARRVVRR